jgi:bacillithiol biosynthesis deacetylase BshB1
VTPALDILVFAPHPDDAEIGCGASLAMAAQSGYRVGIADLTRAERSTRGNPKLREQEATAAAEILGVHERFNLELPDTEVGTETHHRDPIIELIRTTRPRVVLAPYWQDRHPDHAATGRVVRDAYMLAGVAKVGVAEPHRPQRLYHYMLHHSFEPAFVSDVSGTWDQKIAAIRAFASQFPSHDDDPGAAPTAHGFLRHVEARAVHFGAMIGAAYGEPFFSAGPVSMHPFSGGEPSSYGSYSP